MAAKLTLEQERKFHRLCKQMQSLLIDIQRDIPDATLFIDDGTVALYDWPGDAERRPDLPITDGAYWHKASGGGR